MRPEDRAQRKRLLERIRETLMDGHPNPEGYCEWLEGQPISELRKIAASCPPVVRMIAKGSSTSRQDARCCVGRPEGRTLGVLAGGTSPSIRRRSPRGLAFLPAIGPATGEDTGR